MESPLVRLIANDFEHGYLVITRSKLPNIISGKPAAWEYSFFPPRRLNLAFKMYNNAVNLDKHFETYIIQVAVPAWLSVNIPYDSVTAPMVEKIKF